MPAHIKAVLCFSENTQRIIGGEKDAHKESDLRHEKSDW